MLRRFPLARGLDANGDGAITPPDAEWFAKLSDALVEPRRSGLLHYAGLKEPDRFGKRVGFGQPRRCRRACDTLSHERYGLKIDAQYAARSMKMLATETRDLSLPISGLALRGRFVANQDVVEMNALCSELATFIPSMAPLGNPNERWTAVFDLDDTVWAGHIMDLGILAVAHGGLWPSNALDAIAAELGLKARGDVIALAEEWVSRMRLPYGT